MFWLAAPFWMTQGHPWITRIEAAGEKHQGSRDGLLAERNMHFSFLCPIFLLFIRQACGHLCAEFPMEARLIFPIFNVLWNEAAHPRPTARMWEMIKDGRKSFRKSADKTPPFFITLVFLMLREVDRLGYLSRNSLRRRAWIFHQCRFIKTSGGLMSPQQMWSLCHLASSKQTYVNIWEKLALFPAGLWPLKLCNPANWSLITLFTLSLVYWYLSKKKGKWYLKDSGIKAVNITYFGGLFSGRLDQSQIQSAFFFIRFSTSHFRSWKSSSD